VNIGSGLGVDFSELFSSVVALLDVVCFFFFLFLYSIYIAVKGYSESEIKEAVAKKILIFPYGFGSYIV
jgi:hypothetical protein